ncbi:MAG: hypothetical protein Q4A67_05745 [Aerococcus sp.]|nr:hypothetical protein [Aerococcus sp.]
MEKVESFDLAHENERRSFSKSEEQLVLDRANENEAEGLTVKRAVSLEGFVCLILFIVGVLGFSHIMGFVNFMNTAFSTAFSLLTDTVFYLMALSVVVGGLTQLLTEFGVVSLFNQLLSYIMRPIFGLPGIAAVGAVTTYFSDNPALLTLGNDQKFQRYFKKYQLPAMVNLATGFGLGFIVTVFMIGVAPAGQSYIVPVLIGNVAAMGGSFISTRLMLRQTRRLYGTEAMAVDESQLSNDSFDPLHGREAHTGSIFERGLSALMEGGKKGVETGVSIIPGVLIISTIVLMLTFGPGQGGVYTGAANEGIAFLPWLGDKLSFVINPIFGFSDPGNISVPLTALGAAGAAIGLVPNLVQQGLANAHDIAVFTAMAMCLSGYLSTHVAMMDSIGYPEATAPALKSHTIGALASGVIANLLYQLITFIF